MKAPSVVLAAAWLAAAAGSADAQFVATSLIRPSSSADKKSCADPIGGTVTWTQAEPEGDVTVQLELTGITPGEHGFHVHQFGDDSESDTLARIGLHFVAHCVPDDEANQSCDDDTVHGFPPSQRRQSGDMGNITAQPDCTVSQTFVYGQGKMSLSHNTKSIIGRSVLIHERVDNGLPPFGDAGGVYAFGMIGAASGAQESKAAAMSPPTRVHCSFIKEGDFTVSGRALFTTGFGGDGKATTSKLQIKGLTANGEHAVHFSTFGDIVGADALGPEFDSSSAIGAAMGAVKANGEGMAEWREVATIAASASLAPIVGRTMVVHATEDKTSPIIGRAVCGLASPDTTLELTIDPKAPGEPTSAAAGGAVLAPLVAAAAAGFLAAAL